MTENMGNRTLGTFYILKKFSSKNLRISQPKFNMFLKKIRLWSQLKDSMQHLFLLQM